MPNVFDKHRLIGTTVLEVMRDLKQYSQITNDTDRDCANKHTKLVLIASTDNGVAFKTKI